MSLSAHIAKHIRDVHFGGNWTFVNLRDTLNDISWQQATNKTEGFNTIAALAFHINYFIEGVTQVLQGGPLTTKDALSFTHPPVTSAAEWDAMRNKLWADAETFAALIEQLPEEKMWADFVDAKYGNYYRNLQGIIEHTHYHMGQIVIIKKMLQ